MAAERRVGGVLCRLLAGLVPCVAVLAGCELQEVTVVDVEDVVVVEAYALVGVDTQVDPTVDRRLFAFVGRTVGGVDAGSVPPARVEVHRQADGRRFILQPVEIQRCVSDPDRTRPGACYDAGAEARRLRPGDLLELEVVLEDGRTLTGTTRIPGDFALEEQFSPCRLDPDTPLQVRWTRSEGASAYVSETRIDGLGTALQPEGIPAPEELFLLGLSLSASDTTIVFPGEFGVFDRLDLDQELAVRLQVGLPARTRAVVGVTATDPNYVNWARGGNFNPSGQVRLPSVHGDGTGVFASGVLRRFGVFVGDEEEMGAVPRCVGAGG